MIGGRRSFVVGRELLAWAAGRRRRYRVEGPSMEPTLLDGEFVLVEQGRVPSTGELALLTVPGACPIDAVKRVGQLMADGSFWLLSDNREIGTDSRRWGAVEPPMVRGTITLNLARPLAPVSATRSGSTKRRLVGWLRR